MTEPETIDPALTISGHPEYSACTQGEGTLDFNQQGPQGAAGAPGAAGAIGGNGAAGAPGASLIGETTFGISNPAGLTFMKIVGLAGTVASKSHKDEIEVNSFQFGVAAEGGGSAGSGAGVLTGRRVHQSFSIRKEVDASSPKLFAAETAGTVFKKCDIFFARTEKGSEQDFLEIEMTNVVVAGFSQSSGSDRRTESVTFTFSKAGEHFVSPQDKVLSPTLAVSPSG